MTFSCIFADYILVHTKKFNHLSKLNSISLIFDADLYQKGDELFQNNKVLEIIKVDSRIYNAIVSDGKKYEVELAKPLTKSQKFQCDCTFFMENKSCRHVVAALLAFQKTKESVVSKKEKVQKVKSKTITIKSLLASISAEDLKSFVNQYATKDSKFANALKVNFIRHVDVENNEQKYKSLLDSLVKPVTSTHTVLKITDIRHFVKIANDLLEQSQDSIALGEYLEASYILKTLLPKLHYIIHYYDDTSVHLEHIIQLSYTVFAALLEEKKIAIELKKDCLESLIKLIHTSYDHVTHPLYNGFSILYDHKFIPNSELLLAIKSNLNSAQSALEKSHLYAWIFLLKRLLKNDNVFDLPSNSLPLVEKILQALQLMDQKTLCINAAQHFHQLFPREISFVAMLIDLHFQNNETDKMVNVAAQAFSKNQDLRVIDLIKKYPIVDVLPAIRDAIKDNMPTKISVTNEAEAYYKLHDWDGLMALMYEKSDFRMLMKYDKGLFKTFPDELIYLYKSMVDKYLNEHIGDHALIFIAELKNHFNANQMKRITKAIDNLIVEKYSHRTRLNNYDA